MPKRTFEIETSFFNLPKGSYPNDDQNIDFVKRAFGQVFDTNDIQVAFGRGPAGEPLLHKMYISAGMPEKIGSYRSLASLDSGVAKLIGDLIEDLAEGKDATQTVDKLQQEVAKGGGDESGEEEEKPDNPFGEEDELDKEEDHEGDAPFDGAPPPADLPRMPLSRKSNLERASNLEKRHKISMRDAMGAIRMGGKEADKYARCAKRVAQGYNMRFMDALEVVKEAHSHEDFSGFHKVASRSITDENGNALPKEEYVKMGAMARGVKNPLEQKRG